MRFTQHPSNNDVLRAPPGIPNEQVHSVAITRKLYQGGVNSICLYAKPTSEELAALNKGALICLEVLSITTYPVALSVDGVSPE